uniref:Uncharacterized protein n=1 Tax=Klebsiella pneumoniae TaxID=573 RepID=A0A2P1BPE6_KLEPN|nr:hypothetical protein [Klebsiella pneumoniae]
MCGDLLNLPLGYNLHPFESRSRKGVNEHGPVQMSGVSGNFFGLMKRQRNGGENYCERPCRPDSKTGCAVSAPANGLKRVIRVPEGEAPAARRNARAKRRCPQSAGSFIAGTVSGATGTVAASAAVDLSDIRH